jgi:hypothetical protein
MTVQHPILEGNPMDWYHFLYTIVFAIKKLKQWSFAHQKKIHLQLGESCNSDFHTQIPTAGQDTLYALRV